MGKSTFETLVGAAVIFVAVFFIYTAYVAGGSKDVETYELTARFDRIDGLSEGADVRVSGLPVGKVVRQEIEASTYLAKVVFSVDKAVKIPTDSTAEIIGDGLLGGKYLALVPGGQETYYEAGDMVEYTQSAISIESLIGKFVFGGADDKQSGDKAAGDKDPDDIF